MNRLMYIAPFPRDQAYVEFEHQYLRLCLNEGQVIGIATTYTEDEIPDLQLAQSDDALYIVHPNHKPAKLGIRGLSDVKFENEPSTWRTGKYPSSVSFFDGKMWLGHKQDVYVFREGSWR